MKHISKILFYADGAEHESSALESTIKMSDSLAAEVTVADVVARVSTNDTNPAVIKAINALQDTLKNERKKFLDQLAKPYKDRQNLRTEILAGKDYLELIRKVKTEGIDLLVKAVNTPTALSKAFFGEADIKLLRKCPCPVWIMKPSSSGKMKKIVATVDPLDPEHRELNAAIVDMASFLASKDGSELLLLGCWKVPFDHSLESKLDSAKLTRIREGLVSQCHQNLDNLVSRVKGQSVKKVLLEGRAGDLIPEFAEKEEIDLVVMGTLARIGIPGMIIGNTAEKVIHTIQSSVLAVKPEGFVIPDIAD